MTKRQSKLRGSVSLQLVELLADGAEMSGADMYHAGTGVPRGSVYPTLEILVRDGVVCSRHLERSAREAGPARRLYQITDYGRAWLEDERVLVAILARRQAHAKAPRGRRNKAKQ